jgi:hypothetical protein
VTRVQNIRKNYYRRNTLNCKWYFIVVPDAVQSRSKVIPSLSALKMEAEPYFEELVTVTKVASVTSQRTVMFIVTLMRALGLDKKLVRRGNYMPRPYIGNLYNEEGQVTLKSYVF